MRIRLNEDSVRLLEDAAEPGERPQETLNRLLKIRYQSEAYPAKEAFLTYKEIAVRWKKSVSLVKERVRQYRLSDGKVGLGPVVKLGARSAMVPLHAVLAYEKGGVF
jgi:hypothetical protein